MKPSSLFFRVFTFLFRTDDIFFNPTTLLRCCIQLYIQIFMNLFLMLNAQRCLGYVESRYFYREASALTRKKKVRVLSSVTSDEHELCWCENLEQIADMTVRSLTRNREIFKKLLMKLDCRYILY